MGALRLLGSTGGVRILPDCRKSLRGSGPAPGHSLNIREVRVRIPKPQGPGAMAPDACITGPHRMVLIQLKWGSGKSHAIAQLFSERAQIRDQLDQLEAVHAICR